MWFVDTNSYVKYNNPTNSTWVEESKALDLAFEVGRLLNRIIILPEFNCNLVKETRCILFQSQGKQWLKLLNTSTYRESTYLGQPKVPESTKLSISPQIDIIKMLKFYLSTKSARCSQHHIHCNEHCSNCEFKSTFAYSWSSQFQDINYQFYADKML